MIETIMSALLSNNSAKHKSIISGVKRSVPPLIVSLRAHQIQDATQVIILREI